MATATASKNGQKNVEVFVLGEPSIMPDRLKVVLKGGRIEPTFTLVGKATKGERPSFRYEAKKNVPVVSGDALDALRGFTGVEFDGNFLPFNEVHRSQVKVRKDGTTSGGNLTRTAFLILPIGDFEKPYSVQINATVLLKADGPVIQIWAQAKSRPRPGQGGEVGEVEVEDGEELGF